MRQSGPASIASAESLFKVELENDEVRQTIPRLNDSIGRLVTLLTALSGGSVVFLKDEVCVGPARVIAASCFFVGLLMSSYGLLPVSGKGNDKPGTYDENRAKAIANKRWVITGTLVAMGVGLLTAIVGSVIRLAIPHS